MGILECVNSDHAGIIPRAISQIFDYVDSQSDNNDITVSLSFLQLYRETIQDLLAPVNGVAVSEDNLAIREDPARGFYVEGLQEFVVRSYNEAGICSIFLLISCYYQYLCWLYHGIDKDISRRFIIILLIVGVLPMLVL